jgi:hypothetical protein
MKKSATVLHFFGLDCGMLEFFKHSMYEYQRLLNYKDTKPLMSAFFKIDPKMEFAASFQQIL